MNERGHWVFWMSTGRKNGLNAKNTHSTWRFQQNALPTHHTYWRGRCSVELQLQFHGTPAVGGRSRRGLLKAYVCILTSYVTSFETVLTVRP